MTDLLASRRILETLVAFDTTSHRSNLALIEWVEAYLADHGVASVRMPDDSGLKANLFATCGPAVEGGVILSGHSDVVPVAGQDWTSDPWVVREADGRLYGRGTSDMKAFIALALAWVPKFVSASRPVHLAISYDEEVGCAGAPAMIARMAKTIPAPRCAIVGEPSLMRVVTGHKGIAVHEVTVRGHEAHSSLVDQGLSANMVAVRLMAQLADLAEELERRADAGNGFDPPQATLTIGEMEGGTAANILAGHARFVFDLRCPPNEDAAAILAPFRRTCEGMDAQMKARFPGTGVRLERRSGTCAMTPEGSDDAVAFVRALTGENAPPLQVSYAAEGGQFQQAGFPTVICGPGSIEQAHQPDEWIALSQLEAGARFMDRLAEALT
ncbi:acetylornithine deacetylase [Alteriqipengyuania flavescens]|uniref:acetylornithine deacetylase n=1 Tax=Alteriqipengyuania flavescens TaxID=3053610 RepID=UPI0025B43B87|nr:acetylornithine deacetylase [Alteriqipengyuania flavescens]WJY18850.1 acetylornithine deacetylase [Alteriqipengyuania flavescens]WJY24790.1 acetylornithine deacetylase [Alteriqipengyuania flavescens]